jgi:hypothetical protein
MDDTSAIGTNRTNFEVKGLEMSIFLNNNDSKVILVGHHTGGGAPGTPRTHAEGGTRVDLVSMPCNSGDHIRA